MSHLLSRALLHSPALNLPCPQMPFREHARVNYVLNLNLLPAVEQSSLVP